MSDKIISDLSFFFFGGDFSIPLLLQLVELLLLLLFCLVATLMLWCGRLLLRFLFFFLATLTSIFKVMLICFSSALWLMLDGVTVACCRLASVLFLSEVAAVWVATVFLTMTPFSSLPVLLLLGLVELEPLLFTVFVTVVTLLFPKLFLLWVVSVVGWHAELCLFRVAKTLHENAQCVQSNIPSVTGFFASAVFLLVAVSVVSCCYIFKMQ